jgi:hypothetical protein
MLRNPVTNQCEPPYHDRNDVNRSGPHGAASAIIDISGSQWLYRAILSAPDPELAPILITWHARVVACQM